MAKEITKRLEEEGWFQSLIDDCRSLLVEGIYNYRLTLIKVYHLLGKRILEENDNFKREKVYGERLCHAVSESLGQSQRTIWRAIQFAKKYPDLDKFIDTTEEQKVLSWHKIVQDYLPESRENKIELPKGKYQVLLCDPPWPYPERQDAKNLYGNPIYHYEIMSIKEIKELKVGELASENSVLFLWVATNFLEESFDIIRNWGFEYKSQMVWVKESGKQGGIGWYFWGDHELLLVVTKGSMLPKEKFSSVLKAPRREHSKKPDEIYEIIEKMYPNTKRIELFARGKSREGWKAWGDQVDEK